MRIAPIATSSRISGTASWVRSRSMATEGELWKLIRGYGHRILNMDWLTFNNGSAGYRTTINWYFRWRQNRKWSLMGCQSEDITFDKSNYCIFCVTQPSGTPSNSV